jgi:hypothetical protein
VLLTTARDVSRSNAQLPADVLRDGGDWHRPFLMAEPPGHVRGHAEHAKIFTTEFSLRIPHTPNYRSTPPIPVTNPTIHKAQLRNCVKIENPQTCAFCECYGRRMAGLFGRAFRRC